MQFIQLLKRKDGSTLVVAIALGLVLAQFVSVVAGDISEILAVYIGGQAALIDPLPVFDWRTMIFEPAMLALLQIVLIELLIRGYTGFVFINRRLKQKAQQ